MQYVILSAFKSLCTYIFDADRIQFLRHMRDLFQVTYKVDSKKEEIEETLTRQDITLTCVGVGYSNYTKGIL